MNWLYSHNLRAIKVSLPTCQTVRFFLLLIVRFSAECLIWQSIFSSMASDKAKLIQFKKALLDEIADPDDLSSTKKEDKSQALQEFYTKKIQGIIKRKKGNDLYITHLKPSLFRDHSTRSCWTRERQSTGLDRAPRARFRHAGTWALCSC